jgi:hypothetical protein
VLRAKHAVYILPLRNLKAVIYEVIYEEYSCVSVSVHKQQTTNSEIFVQNASSPVSDKKTLLIGFLGTS